MLVLAAPYLVKPLTTPVPCYLSTKVCSPAVSLLAYHAGCIPDHISTFAGYGNQQFVGDNAPATSAGLLYPIGLALFNNSLYIADSGQGRIRRVGPDGIIKTVAGTGVRALMGTDIGFNAMVQCYMGCTNCWFQQWGTCWVNHSSSTCV